MEQEKKARLNIDCSQTERRMIRMLAAREDKSISQYILTLVRKDLQTSDLEPNFFSSEHEESAVKR